MTKRALKRAAIAAAILAAFALAWVAYQEWQRQRLIDDVGDMADLLDPIPDEENAAPLYRQAHAEFEMAHHVIANLTEDPMVTLGYTKGCPCRAEPDAEDQPTPFDDEMKAAAERYIAAAKPAYDLLIEIDNYERARFGDYLNAMNIAMGGFDIDDMARAREIARQLMYRAKWELHHGRHDEALAWVERGLRLANHMQDEATLIAFLVRSAIAGIALYALNDVLCEPGVAVEIPPGIVNELKHVQQRSQYVNVFATEQIVEQAMWEFARSGSNIFQRIEFIPEMRAANNSLVTAMRSVAEPDARARRQFIAEIDPPSGIREMFYELVDPVYAPFWTMGMGATQSNAQMAVLALDRLIARAAMAEIGVYLFQYQAEHGKYPNTLRDLVPEFAESLPEDPFSGHRFFYKPSESGYLLYSVGRDGDDDGGREDWRDGDIVWCIGR